MVSKDTIRVVIFMKKLPQISEAEYEVMKVIWKYAPINTNEITDKLLQCTDWSPKTIHTLIKRLAGKGDIEELRTLLSRKGGE